jgi:hypothetical protein
MKDYTYFAVHLAVELNGFKGCFSCGWYLQGIGHLGKIEEDLCWR